VALVVDAIDPAVDPAEAERLVDRLGPGQARLAGVFLPVADVDLVLGLVVLLEPLIERLG
jgi:hypothetical protein